MYICLINATYRTQHDFIFMFVYDANSLHNKFMPWVKVVMLGHIIKYIPQNK